MGFKNTITLELTKPQADLTIKALLWHRSPTQDPNKAKVLANILRKFREASGAETVSVKLTLGQAKYVHKTLVEWRHGGGWPSTGAWRKAYQKIREALA